MFKCRITLENLLYFLEYFDNKIISMKNFPLGFVKVCSTHLSFGPGAPLTNFNDGEGGGGFRQWFTFFTTSEFVYPKKSLLFLAYPKNTLVLFLQPKKIPLFFFVTEKNPGIFHRPKKITLGQNFRPKIGPPPPHH